MARRALSFVTTVTPDVPRSTEVSWLFPRAVPHAQDFYTAAFLLNAVENTVLFENNFTCFARSVALLNWAD